MTATTTRASHRTKSSSGQGKGRSKRITVNLRDSDYEVLARLSAANGESMSRIVSDLCATVSPALSRVADLAEAANSASEDVLVNLRRVADDSEAVLSPLFASSVDEFNASISRLEDELRPPSV